MKEFLQRCWRFLFSAGIFFVCFSIVLVITLRWLPVSYTPLMFIRCMQATGDKKAKIEHEWTPENEIPNSLQLAVVSTEDQRFFEHFGFDFEEIEKAWDEAENGERTRGASTLSQQTAKNVFLWPSSTYVRKGFEAWFTVLIEVFWGKKHILNVYVNSVEFGDGIYGCEAAAQHFFHKHAAQLSLVESARLAVVLPNPLIFNVAHQTAYLSGRRDWALQQMANRGNVLIFPGEEPEPKVKPKKKKRSK